MFQRLTTAVSLSLLLSACAGGPPPEPPAPPPLDPTGSYNITVAGEGFEIYGVMRITGSAAGAYSGSVDTDMGGAALSNIVVDGQTMTCYIPDVDANIRVVFEGDRFSGEMSGGMGGASIIGTKRSGG